MRLILGALVILGVGALDLLLGRELTAAPFYVVVIGYLAWAEGRPIGLLCALFAGAISVLVDHIVAEDHLRLVDQPRFPVLSWWNGLTRVCVWSGVAWVSSALRGSIARQKILVGELQAALTEVRTLQGLLPICAWCKRIRDNEHDGEWVAIEQYVAQRTAAEFTHSICPACAARARERNV